MKRYLMVSYRITVGLVLLSILSVNSQNENIQEKEIMVCKQKVLWKMRMCPNGKLVCSKNKEYVEKAKHYIKALGSPNFTRRIKAYYKLMKIAPYILPYLKEEYKRVKNFEQMNALIGYGSLNILKDAEIKLMCDDGKNGFMWYVLFSKGAVKTFVPERLLRFGFILLGNEGGVVEGVQVRGFTKDWYISNYSCNLQDRSKTRFAIEVNDGGYTYVVTENGYYRNSMIRSSIFNNFYIIVKWDRGNVQAVINGKESEKYRIIWPSIVSSYSGSRYGFVATKSNGKEVALIDGKESEEYEKIGKIVFSSSGSRYGFTAEKGNGKWVAVIDGKESEEYNKIVELVFSSSGSRYGFTAQKENGKWVAVIDGEESEEYKKIEILGFSSSSSKYGFTAEKENSKWVVVIDGKENGEYHWIRYLAFSPYGERYSLIAQKEESKEIAVIDGKESEEYNKIVELVFSSSGSRYGFTAQKENGKEVAVIDGKESEEYNKIVELVFSSSGSRYGFIAEKENGKWVAVIDGKESKEYDKIEYTIDRWSSDDKPFEFVGRIKRPEENEICEIVVDGQISKGVKCTQNFYKNTLKSIEFRNNKIYRISCKLK